MTRFGLDATKPNDQVFSFSGLQTRRTTNSAKKRQHDDDGDDTKFEGPATTPSCGATKAAAAKDSGSGPTKTGTSDTVTGQQLATLSRLLRQAPRSPGVEASLMQSDPTMPKRRQLLVAMAKQSASMSDPTKARALATATIRRIASTAVAGCVSETELSFGPRFGEYIRTCLAYLRADAWTEQILQPMCIALDAAGPPLEDVPENPGFIPLPSQTSSGSAMMHEADVTPMAGVPGMLQLEKAFHSCCACLSA